MFALCLRGDMMPPRDMFESSLMPPCISPNPRVFWYLLQILAHPSVSLLLWRPAAL